MLFGDQIRSAAMLVDIGLPGINAGKPGARCCGQDGDRIIIAAGTGGDGDERLAILREDKGKGPAVRGGIIRDRLVPFDGVAGPESGGNVQLTISSKSEV
jgi:hypothetical protein